MTAPRPKGPSSATGTAARPRPMASVTRIGLYEREVKERLSRTALEVLFARMECLSEGQKDRRGGREAWFGSTMLTVDLAGLGATLRDACDASTAHRVAALMEHDPDAQARFTQIATAEAERLLAKRPSKITTETRVRAQGTKVFIDVDVEAMP